MDAREVIDQAGLDKLGEIKKRSGSRIGENVRNALQNAPLTFNSWRPYNNPSRLIQVGMSDSEVRGIAGDPDEREFYTDTRQGRFMAIAGWDYVDSARTQATLLEFEINTGTLIRISRPAAVEEESHKRYQSRFGRLPKYVEHT